MGALSLSSMKTDHVVEHCSMTPAVNVHANTTMVSEWGVHSKGAKYKHYSSYTS